MAYNSQVFRRFKLVLLISDKDVVCYRYTESRVEADATPRLRPTKEHRRHHDGELPFLDVRQIFSLISLIIDMNISGGRLECMLAL
jgi:hypothetical protein